MYVVLFCPILTDKHNFIMKEIKECVEYELKNFNSEEGQRIKFTEKLDDGTFNDGTTNEEVVNMLIERFYSLQKKNFYIENQVIISYLKDIRKQLSKRFNKKRENSLRYEENFNPGHYSQREV